MATLEQLDTRVEIITPENIAFQYRIAGPFRRLPAYLLDLLFRLLILLAVAIVALFTVGWIAGGMTVFAVLAVTYFLLTWFYCGLFETFWNGQTPGKRLTRLRVLTIRGEPINAWQAVLRNILRAADILPVTAIPGLLPVDAPIFPLYICGLLSCLCTRRYQRLGDLVCGTMVVVELRDLLSGVVPVAEREVIDLAARLPASCRVSRSLARALASYVDRRRFFSPARREEMARPLGEAFVDRYGLPRQPNYDRLLCALYYRAFVTDRRLTAEQPIAVAKPAEPEDFEFAPPPLTGGDASAEYFDFLEEDGGRK